MLRPRENDFGDDLWSQGLISPVQLFLELLCLMPDFCLELLLPGWIQIWERALAELSLISVGFNFVQERQVVCRLLSSPPAAPSFLSPLSPWAASGLVLKGGIAVDEAVSQIPKQEASQFEWLALALAPGMDLSLSFFSSCRMTEHSVSIVIFVPEKGDDILELKEILLLVVTALDLHRLRHQYRQNSRHSRCR